MILLTGSTGLLGGHVLYALLQKYEHVAALKRPSSHTDTLREIFSYYTKQPDVLLERIEWRSGDLLDPGSLAEALQGISLIINCAAIVSFQPRDRKKLITNNVEGTGNLVKAILSSDKNSQAERQGDERTVLIHISSTSALGDGPGNDPRFLIDEHTPRDPKRKHSGYSVSKFESEQVLKELGDRVIILNPGIILGPGQWNKGSSQLFVKAWEGLKYYPYGGTGYVDVRDIADIITEIGCRVPAFAGMTENGIGYQEANAQSLPVSPSPRPSSTVHRLSSPVTRPPSPISQRYCLVGANLRYREFFNLVTDEFGKPNPSVYAGRFLSGLAWRGDCFMAWIKRRNPLLTRETAESAQRISYYSAEKIIQAIGYKFRPIGETVGWVADCFRKTLDGRL
ncbi:MAG: NAD-dependent epimerase/dehydratase family protein [Bacteroidales bacterium]|jgi:nucleoside-diphosphate-sugar epimerase